MFTLGIGEAGADRELGPVWQSDRQRSQAALASARTWQVPLYMRGHVVGDQARLQLFALAYNLGNFLRRLALPKPVRHWSLTTLREKLIKIGAKVTRHSKYVFFQLAEVAVTRNLFATILDRIARLAMPPPLIAGRAT